MVNVTVVFTNGTIVSFAAHEIDADLVNTYGESSVKKFPYKYAKDQDSVIQLRPKDVVGVYVTPAPSVNPDEMPSLWNPSRSDGRPGESPRLTSGASHAGDRSLIAAARG